MAYKAYLEQFDVFSGFGHEVQIADGRATLPALPGIGFEAQPALYAVMSDLVR